MIALERAIMTKLKFAALALAIAVALPGATYWIASVGFWKKNGGSRVGSEPRSIACAA